MSFSRGGNIPNAVKLGPCDLFGVVGPYVVEPLRTIGATETVNLLAVQATKVSKKDLQIQFIVPGNDCVICPSRWYLAFWRSSFLAVLDEHVPLAVRVLQGVQVKRDQVVEEVTFNLTAKDIYLRA